ncbi:hypothetical protein NXT3_PB00495 (plasmid) [Sinorhizobium fredii]|uniref:Uncharacterized protein n=1 Tax=Rhizobium fredii TaxID=380 RepID=A0A2L0HCF4_RHIFR|nr:hypothetical protein NXT3_PB00495 [Sinorhizobium fredii]
MRLRFTIVAAHLNSNPRARSLLLSWQQWGLFLFFLKGCLTDKIGPLSAVSRQLAMANTCHPMTA